MRLGEEVRRGSRKRRGQSIRVLPRQRQLIIWPCCKAPMLTGMTYAPKCRMMRVPTLTLVVAYYKMSEDFTDVALDVMNDQIPGYL